MVVVPTTKPSTTPEDVPTDATVGVLLIQLPPGEGLDNVIEDPGHTAENPLIGAGETLTVTNFVVRQPVGSV